MGYQIGSENRYLEAIDKALKEGGADAAYAQYLELREGHKETPSYFMYTAQLLHRAGGVPLPMMVQIVTNPLELGLQADPHSD